MKKKDIIKIEQVEEKILMLRGVRVIAVKNNPKKFPKGYVIRLDNNDLEILRSKIFDRKNKSKIKILSSSFYRKRSLHAGNGHKGIKAAPLKALMALRELKPLRESL